MGSAPGIDLKDVTRQPLVIVTNSLTGATSITNDTGAKSYQVEHVQTSALVRIAEALEAQTEILQTTTRARFTPEERQDGLNHYRATHVKGTNVVQVDFLATSPLLAETFVYGMAEVLKAAIASAKQQEGGPADA